MRVVQVTRVGEAKLADVPKPRCGEDEYLLKVHACAICGTDVKIISQGHKLARYPVVPGHEFVATIEAVGKKVKEQGYPFAENDTVVMSPGIPCGRCVECLCGHLHLCRNKTGVGFQLPGGFAEYVVLPEQAALCFLRVPESMDLDDATMMEPVACCVHGQSKMPISPLDTVVIIGAGAIGAIHCELARLFGAARIILVDILDTRLGLIEKLNGAVITVNSTRRDPSEVVMEATKGAGAEKVIIACAAAAAYPLATKVCARDGSILFFSGFPPGAERAPLDINTIHYEQLQILGSFGSTRMDQKRSLDLLEGKRINTERIITHRMPLDQIHEALELIRSGDALKIVLRM
jgi:L-iditol 2-dehydrogenase